MVLIVTRSRGADLPPAVLLPSKLRAYSSGRTVRCSGNDHFGTVYRDLLGTPNAIPRVPDTVVHGPLRGVRCADIVELVTSGRRAPVKVCRGRACR